MTRCSFIGTSISFVIAAGCSSSSTTVVSHDVGGSSDLIGGSTSQAGRSSGGSSAATAGASSSAGASTLGGAPLTGGGTVSTAAGAASEAGRGAIGGSGAVAGTPPATGIGGIFPGLGGSGTKGGTAGGGGKWEAGGAVTAGHPAAGGAATVAAGAAGTIVKGGAAATGGVQALGGARTAGAPATGGISAAAGKPQPACTGTTATECNGTCVDLKTDKSNCGSCGHGCLGGTCVSSLCQAAVLGSAPNPSGAAYAAQVFYVDDTHVYFHSDGVERYRELKTDLGGAGTHLVTGSYLSNFSVVGNTLYWNLGSTIRYCNPANCSATEASSADGNVVANANSTTTSVVTVNTSCEHSSSFCLEWRNADASAVTHEYEDLYSPPTGGSAQYTSFSASGSLVYWIASDYDSSYAFVKGSLFSVDGTALNRAQLAGALSVDTEIVDVNSETVILSDAGDNLYRVPLPLGLGSAAPQAIGVQGVAATEDATKLYWIDSMGTLYSCNRSSCSSTTTVRANGQQYAGRILQDGKAIYWGRANPSGVMRLAK